MDAPFRCLPSVERLLSDQRVRRLVDDYSRGAVVGLVRSTLTAARKRIGDGGEAPSFEDVVCVVQDGAARAWRRWPEPVINATGVILHTNLGRAPLSQDAMDAVMAAARGYSALELDLDDGKRGSRQAHVARLLCELTGAQAALVVNNNASALLLGLAAIAAGREVIVSRGEAVEIGGGFRIPDVLRQSGANLVEVGTTNRTYGRDFEQALTERTGAILSVHASNFRVVGFTHTPGLAELVDLGRKAGVPVLHDLGSGCLLNASAFGLAHEPMPQESVAAGVDAAFFSGDKLLGGPQAGIVVGKADRVEMLARHPLARAMRIDKLSLAALAATLLHYVRDEATEKVPVWRMVAAAEAGLRARASRWADAIGLRATAVRSASTLGGGSLPGETLPTWALSVDAAGLAGGVAALAQRLRSARPAAVGRIEDDRLLLDPRTVLPDEDGALVHALVAAIGVSSGGASGGAAQPESR